MYNQINLNVLPARVDMKKLFLLLLLSNSVTANEIDTKCPQHVIWGAPVVTEGNNQYLCHKGYAVNYNYKTETAYYVLENVTKEHLGGISKRKNNFHDDTEIPLEYRSTVKEYLASGYDRGHLAPAGDFSYSDSAMSESFLMSNMMMQNSNMNRRVWNSLEQFSRKMVNKYKYEYIITGTVFDATSKVVNTVSVPSYMYKIIIDPKRNKILAFLIPNEKTELDFSNYITTVKEIESKTSIDFSPNIPASLKSLETEVGNINDW
jgi:endonuclease G